MKQLLFSLLFIKSCFAALPAGAVFEVRTAGSANNGGCFISGGTGTDYSQQDAAQFNGVDLAIDATLNTKVTSATHSFVSTDVDNCLAVTTGTGFTTGIYRIVSVASNAATLDRAVGTTGSTGGTWGEGGALDSTSTANTNMVNGNTAYVKAGIYQRSTALTLSAGASGALRSFIGYSSTRTDAGKFTWQATAGSMNLVSIGNYNVVKNVIFDANSTSARPVTVTCINCRLENFHAINCLSCDAAIYGIGGNQNVINGYVSNNSVNTVIAYASGGNFHSVAVIGNSCTSCFAVRLAGSNNAFMRGIVAFNTGNSTSGIYCDDKCILLNNVIHSNGKHGIELTPAAAGSVIRNNIITSNGTSTSGKGISASASAGDIGNDYNLFYNNGGGTNDYNNVTAGPHDVNLTGLPYTNAAGGDYSLNNTSGQGAAVRAAGSPGTFTGTSTTGYLDGGPVQHQDPVSGGSGGQRACAFVQ